MPNIPPTPLVVLGCGYLGTALARAARAAGGWVGALTRNVERAGALRALGLDAVVTADLAHDDWHAALDPGGAAVVVCVSPSSPDPEGYRHAFGAGLASVRRWLEASAAAGRPPARDVLFTSATSVYPQTDGGWVSEEDAGEPASLGAAGAALRAAEEAVLGLPAALADRAWVLRLAGLYGPERHHLLDALRAGQRVFPGRGDYWVNLIHRDDAVRAIGACLGRAAPSARVIYNVADHVPVLKRDLLAGLAGLAGVAAAELRCDPGAPATRAPYRHTGAGATPHRRVATTRLEATGWQPRFPSWAEGFRAVLGPAP